MKKAENAILLQFPVCLRQNRSLHLFGPVTPGNSFLFNASFLSFGNVAVGDAAAGKAYFKAHCSSCHSPTGDLAGIATKYPGDELQQRWIYPQPGPAPRVTVTLASGQKYKGKLVHLDEFDVSLYDAQGTYRSFPLTNGTHAEVTHPLAAHYRLMNPLTDTDMHNVTTYLESLK